MTILAPLLLVEGRHVFILVFGSPAHRRLVSHDPETEEAGLICTPGWYPKRKTYFIRAA